MARLCATFGMTVMACDPLFPLPRIAADGFTQVADIAAALPVVDVLTLHCPLGEGTRHMINREMLGLMKPTAWLINAARGTLVDVDALVYALQSKHLAGAAIDVFPTEPKGSGDEFVSPLRGMDNVLLTPHIGGSAEEAILAMGRAAIAGLDQHEIPSIGGR